MSDKNAAELSRPYLLAVVALTLVLPGLSVLAEWLIDRQQAVLPALAGKWFIFWAVGVRLLTAGIRQVKDPAFTAREIFHINHDASHAIVRELGFANICFGLIGGIALFVPTWRVVSAFGSGLYYGIAGANHVVRRPAGANERIALVSDVFIFVVLLIYVSRFF